MNAGLRRFARSEPAHRSVHIVTVTVISVCALLGTPARATDELDRMVKLDVPAQALPQALLQLGQQAGVQIMLAQKTADTKTSKPLRGVLQVRAAIDTLLRDSGLTYEARDNTVTVAEGVADERPFRRAEREIPKDAPGDEVQENSEGRLNGRSAETKKIGSPKLEEVIVTGSRLRETGDERPAPVEIFDRERIDQLGVTSVGDIFNYLPQQSFGFDAAESFAGVRKVQLRGLSAGTTLVLINGQRTSTSALLSAQDGFDLNTIPLAAVERVEVLSDSASAIYGTDAVGGVINVILKSGVEKPELDVYLGTADGGAAERRASFTTGHADGRFKGTFVFDYFNRQSLLGSKRNLTANDDYTRFGSSDLRVPFANPGNICSVDGNNLPGLSAPCAAVPFGSTGAGLTPANFAPTAGQTNLESLSRFQSIVPESRRVSVVTTAAFQFKDELAAFGDFLYAHRQDDSLFAPDILADTTVPAVNPFNPFGVPVQVNYLFTGLGPSVSDSSSEFYHAVAGLRGSLRSWDWELSVLHDQERGVNTFQQGVQTDPNKVAAALSSNDPAQALNVFQDGPGGSPALLASLFAPVPVDHFRTRAYQAAGFIRGPVFSLSAGAAQTVFGAEFRKDVLDLRFNSDGTDIQHDRRSVAAYAELAIPILSHDMRIPLADQLKVTFAGRDDHYSDFGNAFTPEYGLVWHLVPQLLVRAAYGKSFRAPPLFNLYAPTQTIDITVPDPRRNDQPTPISNVSGGNSSLRPEKANSQSVGFEWMADRYAELGLGASYWRIHQFERVIVVSVPDLLSNEIYLPDRVVRAPPTSADIAAGLPGRLLSVDSTDLNHGSVDTSGVDFHVSARFNTPMGRVVPSASATWVRSYNVADFPSTPVIERVGIASFTGTIPRWRATGTIAWSRGPFDLAMTSRTVSSYEDIHTFTTVPNGRNIAGQTLVDAQGALHLGRVVGSEGVVVRLGVANLFDVRPRFSESFGIGYDPSQGDIRQRFVYVTLSLRL